MKTILFLFSFMFVFCVTANTESRDLSAVNTAEDKNIKTAFFWIFKTKNQKLHECFSNCSNCDTIRQRKSCKLNCKSMYSQKEGVKVASIGDQNPFNLLKESQSEDRQDASFEQLFTEDNNHTDKASPILAGYDECVNACVSQCHHEDDCRGACK